MCSASKYPSKHVVPHIFFRQNSIKKILGGDLGTMVWNILSFCFQKRTLRQKKKTFFYSVINQMDNVTFVERAGM